jgi:hypothetical protein
MYDWLHKISQNLDISVIIPKGQQGLINYRIYYWPIKRIYYEQQYNDLLQYV